MIQTSSGVPQPGISAEIRQLTAAAEEADGNPPFAEQTLVRLRNPPEPGQHQPLLLLAFDPDISAPELTAGSTTLVGVAVVLDEADSVTLELAVHPDFRNRGIGTRLLERLRDDRGFSGLQAWSHGNHAAAQRLAEAFGFEPVRELLRLRLTAGTRPAQSAIWPEGVSVRSFVPGQDEAAWLAVNAAAFAHHPEQGAMTLGDLQARMAENWFDPAGFLLAEDRTGQILGFHWTKVHAGAAQQADLGEVYAVGIAPQAQGSGLGKALTLAGIDYLQQRGLRAIMLYVDADNTAAVALYRKIGFGSWDADVMYGLRAAATMD